MGEIDQLNLDVAVFFVVLEPVFLNIMVNDKDVSEGRICIYIYIIDMKYNLVSCIFIYIYIYMLL